MSQSIFLIAERMPADFGELQKQIDNQRLPLSVKLLNTGPAFGEDNPINFQVEEKKDWCEKYCFESPYGEEFLAGIAEKRFGQTPTKALHLVFSSGFELVYGLLALSVGFVRYGGVCYFDSMTSRFADLDFLNEGLVEVERIIRTGTR